MIGTLLLVSLPLLGSFLPASAQSTCNATSLCPTESPCCSEFGFCGTGDFCLGGCNPLASATLSSCAPQPICQNANYTFENFDRIAQNTSAYNGNATAFDFILNGGNISNTNQNGGELAMLLTETNNGTRLSSTRYVQYGTISAKLKTGRWAGVVTAFITMSSIKDEIDWEFTDNASPNTTSGQSNYFWQGYVPAKTVGETHGGLTDTYANYHTYTIDWQQEKLEWLIDGKVVRTLNRNDTVDSSGVYHYPSTPAQFELSIWPAGVSSSPPGEVEWSGGDIDWSQPDYTSAGHFYALVSSVQVTCATNAPAGMDAYTYGANSSAFTPSINLSNATTVIGAAPSSMATPGARMLVATASLVAGVMLFV